MGKCIVCGDSAQAEQTDYCISHITALRNMVTSFHDWSRAFGSIRLEKFLSRLAELPETGEQVKELANFLKKNPGQWPD